MKWGKEIRSQATILYIYISLTRIENCLTKERRRKKKFYLNRYTDMLHYLKSIYVIYAVFNVYAR